MAMHARVRDEKDAWTGVYGARRVSMAKEVPKNYMGVENGFETLKEETGKKRNEKREKRDEVVPTGKPDGANRRRSYTLVACAPRALFPRRRPKKLLPRCKPTRLALLLPSLVLLVVVFAPTLTLRSRGALPSAPEGAAK